MEKLKLSTKILCIALVFFGFGTVSKVMAQTNAYVNAANSFYNHMQAKNYAAMHASFNDKLKTEITLEDLTTNIENMYKTHGKILKNDSLLVRAMPPYLVTILPIYFEKSNLELRLAFDGSHKIGGLFFTVFEPKKGVDSAQKVAQSKLPIKVKVTPKAKITARKKLIKK